MSIATRGVKRGVSGWTRLEATFYAVAAVAILVGAVDLVDYYGATMAVASAVNSAARSAVTGGARAIAAGDIVKVVVGAGGLDSCGIGQIDIYGPTGDSERARSMARDRYIFSHCATPGAVAVPSPNTLLYSPDAGTSAASITVRVLYRYHPPISLFGLDDTLVLAGRASQAVGSSLAIGVAPTPVPVSGALSIPACGALPPAPVIRQIVGAGRRDTLSWTPGATGATGAPGATGTVAAPASGGWTIIQYHIDPLIAEQTVLQVAHVPAGQTTVALNDVSGQRVTYGVAGLNSCGVPGQQSALVDDGRAQSVPPVPSVPAAMVTTTPATTTATGTTTVTAPATPVTTATGTTTATAAAMPATATMTTQTAGATTTATPTATVPTVTAMTATATVTVGATTTATVTVGVTTTATATMTATATAATTATTMAPATATAAAVQPSSPGIPLVPTPCAGVPVAPAIQRVVSAGQEDIVMWAAASSGPAASGGWTVARYHIDSLIAERTVLGIAHIPAGQTTARFTVPPGQRVSYGVSGLNGCGVPGPESALATDGR